MADLSTSPLDLSVKQGYGGNFQKIDWKSKTDDDKNEMSTGVLDLSKPPAVPFHQATPVTARPASVMKGTTNTIATRHGTVNKTKAHSGMSDSKAPSPKREPKRDTSSSHMPERQRSVPVSRNVSPVPMEVSSSSRPSSVELEKRIPDRTTNEYPALPQDIVRTSHIPHQSFSLVPTGNPLNLKSLLHTGHFRPQMFQLPPTAALRTYYPSYLVPSRSDVDIPPAKKRADPEEMDYSTVKQHGPTVVQPHVVTPVSTATSSPHLAQSKEEESSGLNSRLKSHSPKLEKAPKRLEEKPKSPQNPRSTATSSPYAVLMPSSAAIPTSVINPVIGLSQIVAQAGTALSTTISPSVRSPQILPSTISSDIKREQEKKSPDMSPRETKVPSPPSAAPVSMGHPAVTIATPSTSPHDSTSLHQLAFPGAAVATPDGSGLPVNPFYSLSVAVDCHRATAQDKDGDTPLHIAVVQEIPDLALIGKLISLVKMSDKSLDIFNYMQQTPLHLAVICTQLEVTRLLLEGGANPNEADRNGHTSVHHAILQRSASCLACIFRYSTFEIDLDKRNFDGYSPLHVAVERGQNVLVRMLIDNGANVNAGDSKNGWTPLFNAVSNKDVEMIGILIEAGSKVNAQSYSGNSALHIATGRGYTDVVKVLVQAGADLSLKNSHWDTPLNVASSGDMNSFLRGICRGSPTSNGSISSSSLDKVTLGIGTSSVKLPSATHHQQVKNALSIKIQRKLSRDNLVASSPPDGNGKKSGKKESRTKSGGDRDIGQIHLAQEMMTNRVPVITKTAVSPKVEPMSPIQGQTFLRASSVGNLSTSSERNGLQLSASTGNLSAGYGSLRFSPKNQSTQSSRLSKSAHDSDLQKLTPDAVSSQVVSVMNSLAVQTGKTSKSAGEIMRSAYDDYTTSVQSSNSSGYGSMDQDDSGLMAHIAQKNLKTDSNKRERMDSRRNSAGDSTEALEPCIMQMEVGNTEEVVTENSPHHPHLTQNLEELPLLVDSSVAVSSTSDPESKDTEDTQGDNIIPYIIMKKYRKTPSPNLSLEKQNESDSTKITFPQTALPVYRKAMQNGKQLSKTKDPSNSSPVPTPNQNVVTVPTNYLETISTVATSSNCSRQNSVDSDEERLIICEKTENQDVRRPPKKTLSRSSSPSQHTFKLTDISST